MTKILLPLLAIVLLLTAAPAQKAAFNSYGSTCRSNILQVQGLPKLGTSFTVSRILYPGGCTRKFCLCACCNCNTCSGSVLFLGIGKTNFGLPGGCTLLTTTEFLLFGNTQGNITLPVPNQSVLNGIRFYMQRLDIQSTEVTGTNCPRTYVPTAFSGASNGVEGIIGT